MKLIRLRKANIIFNQMKTKNKKLMYFLIIIAVFSFVIIRAFSQRNCDNVAWDKTVQQIPGKIQCEFYDLGGEGVAYHDFDSVNQGSGKLNLANGTFLNEFRKKEGVDISYTKSQECDNSPFNLVEPEMGQLYVGWTKPGEWINYTVNVIKSGNYNIGIMYAANGNGEISLDLGSKALSAALQLKSTRNEKDSLEWRQIHHWNRIDSLTTVKLNKGIQVLKFRTVTNGKMNYDYINFKLKD